MPHRSRIAVVVLAVLAVAATFLPSAAPRVANAATGGLPRGEVVFPSNRLTVRDAYQLTGRRLDLPMPNCRRRPSDCNTVRLLNQLDGFDLDPRIVVQLDAPLPDAEGLGRTLGKGRFFVRNVEGGDPIPVNRLVYDRRTLTLSGHPRRQLAERTTYRVTYDGAGPASTTTFTTLSASRVLTQMRRQLDDGSAYRAAGIRKARRGLRFDILKDGGRAVFEAADVIRIRRLNDRMPGEPLVAENVLNTVIGARLYAFGSFDSPSWLTRNRHIPQTDTANERPRVRGFDRVGFTMIVPRGEPPEGGWPVAIFGPGITRSKYDLFLAADANAARGLATVSFDPVGHAFGPRSKTAVTTASSGGEEVRFTAFGRATVLDANGVYDPVANVQAPVQPHRLGDIGLRDGLRQTAADVMAFSRAIGRGVDVDGDGNVDLRRRNVSLYAQSLGGIYGTMVTAVDDRLKVAALNVPGGPIADIARLAPAFRPNVAAALDGRIPSLLNGGRDCFTESLPLWAEEAETEPARGALKIQRALSRSIWLNRSGSPEAFAPRLLLHPLTDSAPKRVIYQYAFGDATVPNPTSATIMRAGRLASRTTYYRNDRTPTAEFNPHGFLLDPRITGREQGQQQVLDFLVNNGRTVIDPDGPGPVFEVPIEDRAALERNNFDFDEIAANRDQSRPYTSADGSNCP